jgi:hypothetical protein
MLVGSKSCFTWAVKFRDDSDASHSCIFNDFANVTERLERSVPTDVGKECTFVRERDVIGQLPVLLHHQGYNQQQQDDS